VSVGNKNSFISYLALFYNISRWPFRQPHGAFSFLTSENVSKPHLVLFLLAYEIFLARQEAK